MPRERALFALAAECDVTPRARVVSASRRTLPRAAPLRPPGQRALDGDARGARRGHPAPPRVLARVLVAPLLSRRARADSWHSHHVHQGRRGAGADGGDRKLFCVVGSGPAGMYAADRPLSHYGDRARRPRAPPHAVRPRALGRRPGPRGDEPVTNRFDAVLADPRVAFLGNVALGRDASPWTTSRRGTTPWSWRTARRVTRPSASRGKTSGASTAPGSSWDGSTETPDAAARATPSREPQRRDVRPRRRGGSSTAREWIQQIKIHHGGDLRARERRGGLRADACAIPPSSRRRTPARTRSTRSRRAACAASSWSAAGDPRRPPSRPRNCASCSASRASR